MYVCDCDVPVEWVEQHASQVEDESTVQYLRITCTGVSSSKKIKQTAKNQWTDHDGIYITSTRA